MGRILANAILALPLVGAFSMFALGIVVTYRASRVLNLAHGAMATFPAYVAYSLAEGGVPLGVAFAASIAAGGVLGLLVERFVLRPLGGESPTTQTVGTVAVFGLLIAVIARIWGTEPLTAPNIFPDGFVPIGGSRLQYGEIGLAIVALVVTAGFILLFRATNLGLAMRAAAENRRASALMGIDPDRTTATAWTIGGALAAAAGTMLAGVTTLHVFTLPRQVLPAFVAALIGGLGSLPGALTGAAVVGLAYGVIPSLLGSFGDQPGTAQLVLTVVALIAMATRGSRLAGAAELAASTGRIALRRARGRRWWLLAAVPVLLAFPLVPLDPSIRQVANLTAVYTVVAVSLVVLTGWVGQISLGHASFVGVAAFTTGLLVRKAGVPFPLNLPIAAAVAAGAAVLLGVVALRVRGLYLAVATLIFGWMADAYLFKASWFVGEGGSSTIPGRVVGRPEAFPSFDLTNRRVFYYIVLAAAALALLAAANLRDSRTGRALFAVRGSEVAAASLGINITRYKLLAFGISGMLAGVAGNLIMIDRRTAGADDFSLPQSLFFLAIACVGGLSRLGGAVAAAAVFAAMEAVFFNVRALDGYLDIASSGLLLAAVLASAAPVRRWIGARLPKRAQAEAASVDAEPIAPAPARAARPAPQPTPALEVDAVTVRFGGLVASNDVTLDVREGEITGLIGPNGAGKTTLFNAVSGMVVPAAGTIRLFGHDATALDVHERAALGLGRTFQVIQLFADATVFDNLLVATHLHARSGAASHLFVTDRALRDEAAARERVRDTLALVGLTDVAGVAAGDLPFGVQRMVEVGRALVTGARLVMLDEPASGLDNRETDHLAVLLERVRAELGTSLLVVEHDVRFVTSISDRLFVLDRGTIIASGTPAAVQRDPAVLAAYLGSADGDDEPVLAGVSG